jgi:GNAT superfamily N-acetyltransferase
VQPDLIKFQEFTSVTWLRIRLYAFHIFVAPAERKIGISSAFQNNATLVLRSKGYTKAYGYYFSDYIPAIWCTRVTNKWKEVRAARVSRFLVFTRVVPLQGSNR